RALREATRHAPDEGAALQAVDHERLASATGAVESRARECDTKARAPPEASPRPGSRPEGDVTAHEAGAGRAPPDAGSAGRRAGRGDEPPDAARHGKAAQAQRVAIPPRRRVGPRRWARRRGLARS